MSTGGNTLSRAARVALPLAAVILAGGVNSAFATHRAAKMYAVSTWTNECTGGERDNWPDMVEAWYDALTDGPYYHQAGKWINGNLNVDILCDPSSSAACADAGHIDAADAAMIGVHGTDSSNHWAGKMRRMSRGECFLDGDEGAGSDQFFVGKNLDILSLSSCQSMDDDNLPNTWRMFFNPSGGKLKEATGFHGLMWISYWRIGDYDDFGEDAQEVSIKNAWLDDLYDYNIGDDNVEQCPVAYSIGTNLDDCVARLKNTRYGNEPAAISSFGAWCYYTIKNCDPAGETAFTKP